MSNFITLILAGIFTENIVTAKLCGLSAVSRNLGAPQNILKRFGFLTAMLVTFALVSFPLKRYLLPLLGVEYLEPLLSLLIVGGILFAVFKLSKLLFPCFYGFLKEQSLLLTGSAMVLCLALQPAENELVKGIFGAALYALCSGVGFMVVAFIFYAVNSRLEETDLPAPLKGLPTILLIASFISMAFSGLA